MKQFQAGYMLQGVRESLFSFAKSEKTVPQLNGLLRSLSTFNVQSSVPLEKKGTPESIYAVATNIITRGLPTLPSVFLEEEFSSALGLTKKNGDTLGKIDFSFTKPIQSNLFYRALHIIDSNAKDRRSYLDLSKVDSDFERSFLLDLIPSDHSYLAQLFEQQRSRSSFTQDNNQGRVDFSFEIPYDIIGTRENRYKKDVNIKHHRKFIVEVDGARYHTDLLDDLKDFEIAQLANNISHIREGKEYQHAKELVASVTQEKYVAISRDNYLNSDYPTNEITALVLSPFAVARIQRVILGYLMANPRHTSVPVKVAVIERDIPCGRVALSDLTQWLHTLNDLAASSINLPEFKLEIFGTEKFVNHSLHAGSKPKVVTQLDPARYDIVIDISMLRREGIFKDDNLITANNVIKIRSSHYVHHQTKNGVVSAPLITYRDLVIPLPNEVFQPEERICDGLKKVLQNIFRKLDFRPGQLPILNRALKQKSVIGLLPTGGGKSLTYQLAALLQPGVTVVIDPIRSLMQDQFEGLREIGIDKCEFINSKLTAAERRYNQNVLLADGQLQFVFVSPERFVIEEFRHALDKSVKDGHYFAYAVIDEVHCVSEWGHDFRTPYLNLGENAQQFCITYSGRPIPLFGLTATASFDVLADIERELSIAEDDGEAVIRFENTVRDELNYIIKDVPASFKGEGTVTEKAIREKVGARKQEFALELIKQKNAEFKVFNNEAMLAKVADRSFKEYLPISLRQQQINRLGSEEAAGKDFITTVVEKLKIQNPFSATPLEKGTTYNYGIIVFTPHRQGWLGIKSGIGSHGFFDKPGYILTKVTDTGIDHHFGDDKLGYFMGSGDDENAEVIDEESFQYLADFKDCKCSLMVATKAFGMGIDKPNVRLTIHLNIPQSIESFVQEAGRGGRDGKVCTSVILFNNDQFPIKKGTSDLFHLDKDVLMYFHKNSFKGQIKERVMIHELRNRITFPNARNIQMLSEQMNDLYGTDILQFEVKRGGPNHANRIFVNTLAGESVGYVFIDTGRVGIYQNLADDGLCYELVNWLKNQIPPDKLGKLPAVSEWLQTFVINHQNEVGIEKMLTGMEVGAVDNLVIPFTNKYYSKKHKDRNLFVLNPEHLAQVCTSKAIQQLFGIGDPQVSTVRSILADAVLNGWDYPEFVERIVNESNPLRQQLLDLKNSISLELQRVYFLPRGQDDTSKAIYRLVSVGIIDSYTIDYNRKLYNVTFTKRTEDDYFDRLEQLIARYTSKNVAKREVAKLVERSREEIATKKATVISKCLEFLTDFIYGKIKEKRLQAISDMVKLCQNAIRIIDPLAQNLFVKDEIYYYFNAKYTRRGFIEITQSGEYEASMPDDLDNGIETYEMIVKYVHLAENDETGEFVSNIKHLRGSTMRMLRSNPDEPACNILKAYSLFIMGDTIKLLLKDAKEELVKGLIRWKENDPEFTMAEFLSEFKEWVGKHVLRYDIHDVLVDVEDQYYATYYAKWTARFNKRISSIKN